MGGITIFAVFLYLNQVMAINTELTAEYMLIENLTKFYNPNVRPVRNNSHAVTVNIGIALNQIVDVDEPHQILHSMVWMRIFWVDEFLSWNPEDYEGVSSIRLTSDKVWKPDITLYNDVSEKGMSEMPRYDIVIEPDGNAHWFAPVRLQSSCKLDIGSFPYDQQNCLLTFGSWTLHGFDLDLHNRSASGDDSSFVSNGEWDLIRIPVERKVKYYACCPEPYPFIAYTVVLRRRALYYTFNLLLPCVIITAVTIMGFYLPPDSGEKVSLSVTILLSLTVFLLLVAEAMPPNAETIPLIGWFFALSIITVALSTVTTVFILGVHHKGWRNGRVPFWLKRIVFHGIAPMIGKKDLVAQLGYNKESSHKVGNMDVKQSPAFVLKSERLRKKRENDQDNNSEDVYSYTERVLEEIFKNTSEIERYTKLKELAGYISGEWHLMAVILDRFFMIVFLIITVVLTTVIFAYSPNYD